MPGYKWKRYDGERGWTPNMITVGRDKDDAQLVVARAYYEGDMLPAKGKPEHGVAYVSYNGAEIPVYDFEILMPAEFRWIPSCDGEVPPGAVEGGRTRDGEPLYIGRTHHHGTPVVGKVHPSHRALYIAYNGEEIRYNHYEILIQY